MTFKKPLDTHSKRHSFINEKFDTSEKNVFVLQLYSCSYPIVGIFIIHNFPKLHANIIHILYQEFSTFVLLKNVLLL